MNDPMRSTQESVMAALKAVDLTSGTTYASTRGIMVGTAGNYTLYFTDASTGIALPLLASVVYPFNITKFDTGAGKLYGLY